jgi:hypothetical protein
LALVSTAGGTNRMVQGQQGIYTHCDALWHSFESQAIRSLRSSLSNSVTRVIALASNLNHANNLFRLEEASGQQHRWRKTLSKGIQ